MVPRKVTRQLADAIDKYQTTFDRMLGLLCALNMPDRELLRRINSALEAGEPIAEDDYTFYWKIPPGVILAPRRLHVSRGE